MNLYRYFALVDAHARLSLRADASSYYFGYIWWIIEPLLYVSVFYLVFEVILVSGRADFLAFLMCGKLTFIWFSKSVSQASNSLVENRGLLGMVNISKPLFPLALIQQGLYKQVAVFVLLFSVLLFSGYEPSQTWFWIIPLIMVNYLLIVACSLVGACLVSISRDFSLIIGLAMTFLLFSSGVFWDARELSNPQMMNVVLQINPLAFMIDAYRQILMYGNVPDMVHLSVIGSFALVLILIMSAVMKVYSQQLAWQVLTK